MFPQLHRTLLLVFRKSRAIKITQEAVAASGDPNHQGSVFVLGPLMDLRRYAILSDMDADDNWSPLTTVTTCSPDNLDVEAFREEIEAATQQNQSGAFHSVLEAIREEDLIPEDDEDFSLGFLRLCESVMQESVSPEASGTSNDCGLQASVSPQQPVNRDNAVAIEMTTLRPRYRGKPDVSPIQPVPECRDHTVVSEISDLSHVGPTRPDSDSPDAAEVELEGSGFSSTRDHTGGAQSSFTDMEETRTSQLIRDILTVDIPSGFTRRHRVSTPHAVADPIPAVQDSGCPCVFDDIVPKLADSHTISFSLADRKTTSEARANEPDNHPIQETLSPKEDKTQTDLENVHDAAHNDTEGTPNLAEVTNIVSKMIERFEIMKTEVAPPAARRERRNFHDLTMEKTELDVAPRNATRTFDLGLDDVIADLGIDDLGEQEEMADDVFIFPKKTSATTKESQAETCDGKTTEALQVGDEQSKRSQEYLNRKPSMKISSIFVDKNSMDAQVPVVVEDSKAREKFGNFLHPGNTPSRLMSPKGVPFLSSKQLTFTGSSFYMNESGEIVCFDDQLGGDGEEMVVRDEAEMTLERSTFLREGNEQIVIRVTTDEDGETMRAEEASGSGQPTPGEELKNSAEKTEHENQDSGQEEPTDHDMELPTEDENGEASFSLRVCGEPDTNRLLSGSSPVKHGPTGGPTNALPPRTKSSDSEPSIEEECCSEEQDGHQPTSGGPQDSRSQSHDHSKEMLEGRNLESVPSIEEKSGPEGDDAAADDSHSTQWTSDTDISTDAHKPLTLDDQSPASKPTPTRGLDHEDDDGVFLPTDGAFGIGSPFMVSPRGGATSTPSHILFAPAVRSPVLKHDVSVKLENRGHDHRRLTQSAGSELDTGFRESPYASGDRTQPEMFDFLGRGRVLTSTATRDTLESYENSLAYEFYGELDEHAADISEDGAAIRENERNEARERSGASGGSPGGAGSSAAGCSSAGGPSGSSSSGAGSSSSGSSFVNISISQVASPVSSRRKKSCVIQ